MKKTYLILSGMYPAGNYMLKINNRNTRTRCVICSKLTIKTPEQYQWCRSGFFIGNFEHISRLILLFLLLTLNRQMPTVYDVQIFCDLSKFFFISLQVFATVSSMVQRIFSPIFLRIFPLTDQKRPLSYQIFNHFCRFLYIFKVFLDFRYDVVNTIMLSS